MWIRHVDLPADLIEAHRAGRLVLFVGAGTSIASPSGLPTFSDDIASESGIERNGQQEDQLTSSSRQSAYGA
jgi:hypothetical protein